MRFKIVQITSKTRILPPTPKTQHKRGKTQRGINPLKKQNRHRALQKSNTTKSTEKETNKTTNEKILIERITLSNLDKLGALKL